ncbi:MAG: hypothetical protein ABI723_07440 [Bacteroidia bacterium]
MKNRINLFLSVTLTALTGGCNNENKVKNTYPVPAMNDTTIDNQHILNDCTKTRVPDTMPLLKDTIPHKL